MNKRLKFFVVCLAMLTFTTASAQLPSNKIKPAEMYKAGDTLRSARLGLQTIVPNGWRGVLPRDTEVFLLLPENNVVGEIYVFVSEAVDLKQQTERWRSGSELAPGLILKPEGEVVMRGADVISSVGKLSGTNANNYGKIYAESKCSPVGFCITYLSTSDAANYSEVVKALQSFVDNTGFTQPSTKSPFIGFDWKPFLSGKILLAIGDGSQGKRVDELDLCADGSFRSDITRTGIFKDQAKGYQGSKKGSWKVVSKDNKAVITLSFSKLPPVDIELEAKDEEVYIKGIRYFVGESERCSK